MSGQLTAANIRAAVDSLANAGVNLFSVSSVSYTVTMHPDAYADLMQETCSCGSPATHHPKIGLPLCDGHWFQYKVMKAAGRLPEFLKGLER